MKNYDSREYYDFCHEDYRMIWQLDQARGFHYGYHDEQHTDLVSAILNVNETIADVARIKKGARVLDAGCGIGGTCIWLAKNCGALVTGINLSEKQILIARREVQDENLGDQVTILEDDLDNLTLPADSFDVYISIEAFCYAVDKEKALEGAYRVLKEGGRFVVIDFFLPRPKSALKGLDKKLIDIMEVAWMVPYYAVIDRYRMLMEKVGFKNVKVMDNSDLVLPSSKRLFWMGMLYYLPSRFQLLMRRKKQAQHNNVVNAITQYVGLKRKNWKHMLFYGEK